jgi:hypothetical protein
MKFDIFTIYQWSEGYTLEVEKGRPRNAPRGKFTKADRKRRLASLRKTMELRERIFPTLEEVCEEIKRLEIPKAGEQ